MTREEKICAVVEAFLRNPNLTIAQLSELPELAGISKSSIQRYLNDPIISQLFDEQVFNNVKDKLQLKGLEARKKGGMMSFKNNVALKSEDGKFVGVEKTKNSNNVSRKIKHILIFAQLFLEHPEYSLQDIADLYNNMNPLDTVTRDYVYDCLSEHDKYELFSEKVTRQISLQLEQRRLMGNRNGADITNQIKGMR